MKWIVESKVYDSGNIHTLIRPLMDDEKKESYGRSFPKYDYYADVTESLSSAIQIVRDYKAFY